MTTIDLTTLSDTALSDRYFYLVEDLRAAEDQACARRYIESLNEVRAELLRRLAA